MGEVETVNLDMSKVSGGIDENGQPTAKYIDSSGREIPFNILLGEGRVPFYVPITISAESELVAFAVDTTVRPLGTKYVFPTIASTLTVVSDDAEDGVGGTGIRQLIIRGLDINYLAISEVILTDGLTPVATTKEFFRVNEVNVEVSGTNNGAVGHITIKQGTNPLAYIETGRNITRQGIFTVPAGTKLFIDHITGSAGKDDEGKMRLLVTNPVNNIPIEILSNYFYENSFNLIFERGIIVPEKHDIEYVAIKSGSAGTANFSLYVENTLIVDKI